MITRTSYSNHEKKRKEKGIDFTYTLIMQTFYNQIHGER